MEKNLLVSIAAIGLAAATMGVGTYAFFSDTGTSSDNLFSATTIDLHLNNTGGAGTSEDVTASIGASDWSPGDSDSGTIGLTKSTAGNPIPDAELDLSIAFATATVECSTGGHCTAGGTDIRDDMDITTLTYGAVNLETSALCDVPDTADFLSLDGTSCNGLAAPGTSPSFTDFVLSVTYTDTGAPQNNQQGDVASITITFRLAQLAAPDI